MDFIFAGGREMTIADLDEATNLLIGAAKTGKKAERPVRWMTIRGEDI